MWQDKSDDVVRGASTPPFELHLSEDEPNGRNSARLDGTKRNIAKTATYAVMHFCVAIAVAFALTGDMWIALSIGLIEPIVQTFAYAMHEYGWSRKKEETASSYQAQHRRT